MTIQEAKDNIGKQFKYKLFHRFDVIRSVTDDDFIVGDMLIAPPEDCVLKQEQPVQLRIETNICATCGFPVNSMAHMMNCNQ